MGLKCMDKSLETYLLWRFKVNNANRYQRYVNDWIYNLTENQLNYFAMEMERLINRGIYKGL
jgi:hypothetical protein